MGDRLGAGEMHDEQVEDSDRAGPADQDRLGNTAPKQARHEDGGNDVGGGEEGREMRTGEQLCIAQGGRGIVVAFVRQRERFPARKAG